MAGAWAVNIVYEDWTGLHEHNKSAIYHVCMHVCELSAVQMNVKLY